MRIESVTIEGMHNVAKKTYTFDDITYLYGSNGVGKSTVIQAIQLALLGYIPGTAKRKSDIFKHANGHALAITLKLDDNGPIMLKRVWSGTASNLASDVTIQPDGYDVESILKGIELPIFDFSEFLNLSANELKNWFIEFLPRTATEIDWRQELVDSLHATDAAVSDEYIDEIVDTINKIDVPESELVKAVNAKLKDILSFTQKELTRAQNTIQSLVYYDDIDTDILPEHVADKIARYEAEKSAQDNSFRLAQSNARVQAALEQYKEYDAESVEADIRYIEMNKAFEKCAEDMKDAAAKKAENESKLSAINKQIQDAQSIRSEFNAAIAAKQSIITSGGICPYTKSQCDSIKTLIQEYEDDVADMKSEMAEVDASISKLLNDADIWKAAIRVNQDSLNMLQNEQINIRTSMNSLISKYREKGIYESQLVEVPEVQVSGIDYAEEIRKLRDLQVKYAANARYNELIDKLTADKFEIDSRITALKSWIKLTGPNGLQVDDACTAAFIQLASNINKYVKVLFGHDVSAKFNLESKANSFSFGLVRNEKYISYNLLSSGEKCMFTLALMISIVEQADCPLKLIMVDDSFDHLDDTNITNLFTSLHEISNVQLIFAGVKHVDSNYAIEVVDG